MTQQVYINESESHWVGAGEVGREFAVFAILLLILLIVTDDLGSLKSPSVAESEA